MLAQMTETELHTTGVLTHLIKPCSEDGQLRASEELRVSLMH
jgi:hypothetical protein